MSSSPETDDQSDFQHVEDEIRCQLLKCGIAQSTTQDGIVSVAEWRSTARAIGRALKRPIKTFLAGNSVYAILGDWPRDDEERTLHQQNVHDAAVTMNELVAKRLGVK
ncbi:MULTISPECIES: hypothetical protein [Brevibacterium]|uniref:Uncharacterized protein n=2 Tax=Brevibacterium TaxID=1696 RepID=A0A6G8KU42_9MICO|nr:MULTISPECIES: hypothetical protein [Brevibacterium]MBD8021425.1 hypothetical protein [Brevibacterium gallinarum]QIN28141.1 hypothetical protein EW640_01715 [Brevibacterium luteolum]